MVHDIGPVPTKARVYLTADVFLANFACCAKSIFIVGG